MADYSGYYSCQECGRSGDVLHPTQHTDTCSVPGKIAQALREAQLRKDAEKQQRIDMIAEFEDMTDDQVIAHVREAQRILDDHRAQMKPIEKRVDAGLEVIRRRPGLVQKFLNR